MAMDAGTFVLVMYRNVGEELFHEMIVTGRSGRLGRYALYSTDGNHYVMNLNLATKRDLEQQVKELRSQRMNRAKAAAQ